MGCLTALISLAGCGQQQTPLPTFDPGEFCSAGELLPTQIHADPAADPAVWGTNQAGERVELVWPIGFTASLSGGTVEIADLTGKVVARSGQMLIGAGGGRVQGSNGPIGLCSFEVAG